MTTPPGDGRTRLAPLLLLVLLGSLWGLGFSLAKIATRGGVPPITYSFWQSAAAAVVLSAITVLRGVRPSLSARHLRFYLVMGITGFSIPNVNIIMSVAHLPAGIAAVIVPLSPLFTCAIAWEMGFEGMSAGRAVGLALGLAGTALIALPQASLPEPEQRFWVLMATMTPLFYAIGNVVAPRACARRTWTPEHWARRCTWSTQRCCCRSSRWAACSIPCCPRGGRPNSR